METNQPRLAIAFVLSGLAACGGGGGGGTGGVAPVAGPSNLAYSDDDALELSGVEIAPLLPTFDGDVDAFDVVPGLPPGLVLDPLTGVVAGTPLAPAARRTYTITARNAGGSASIGLRLEVGAPQRFAFVSSATDDSLATLAVDTVADRLLRGPLALSAPADVGAERAVAHPNGHFVYVPHATSNTLAVWRVDEASGALNRLASVPLGAGPHAAVFHPSGAWLLVTSQLDDQIQVFSVGAGNGLLTETGVVALGTQPSDAAFSPDGRQLFVTHAGIVMNGLGSSLASYAFDEDLGTLALQAPPLALNGGRPLRLVVDPHESLVYLTLSMFDAVLSVRTSASGALTPIAPLRPAGDEPADLAVDARGRFLFVADSAEDSIRVFAVQPGTGALTTTGTFAAGDEPRGLRADPLGERLFAVARGSGELLTYAVANDGSLEQDGSLAVRPGTGSIAFATGAKPLAWAPRFVHCANTGSDDVHAFRVDAETGALTFSGQAFTDDAPTSLAIDPRTLFAVVVAEGAHTVQSFAISGLDGTLSPAAPSVAVTGTPTHVAIDPSGRFAYVTARDVALAGDGWLLTFAIEPLTGALTQIDARPAGSTSCSVAIEPTGEYAYVANRGNGTPGTARIAAFRLDSETGIPAAVGSPVVAPGITDLAFHPDGRTAYAVLRGSDALARYAIDRASGDLTAVPPVAGTGLEPAALVLDPRRRFAWASYTGNAALGEIDVLPVLADGQFGAVQQSVVDGDNPIAMALDASGRFLYAANQGSHDISILAVDPATGMLTARVPMIAGTAPTAIVASGTTY